MDFELGECGVSKFKDPRKQICIQGMTVLTFAETEARQEWSWEHFPPNFMTTISHFMERSCSIVGMSAMKISSYN